MRSAKRSSAIGGTAPAPLTATEPPYFTRAESQQHHAPSHDGFDPRPNFTRATLDELVDELRSARVSSAAALDVHTDVHDVLSLGAYRGELRRAIHHMKYRNARWIAAYFGRALADALREADAAAAGPAAQRQTHIVTWAPTTRRRISMRGHDQSAIIASAFARKMRIRCVRTLRRVDDNTQTGSTRESRKRGPQFVARSRAVRGRRVILIDDVMTTGSTLARARDALLVAGALEVRCAVIAHVRARHPSRIG
jgi:ComF family protein